ncbi:MAG: thioredoxin family protein [Planctomycetota bacterium]
MVLVVVTVALINVILRGNVAPTPPLFADGFTLTQAIAKAQGTDRPVIAVASANWCGPCQTYKRTALSDPRVTDWVGANAVPVYIDVSDGIPAEAVPLNIQPIPATFVLRDGEVVASFAGALPADDLLGWLETQATPRAANVAP